MTGFTRKIQREAIASMFSGGQRRAIIVSLVPPGSVIGFRLKGTRKTYFLPVDFCYREALRAAVTAERAERKAARKAKK